MPRLGREEAWFALGWLALLAGPAVLRALDLLHQEPRPVQTVRPEVLTVGPWVLAAIFLGLLAAGSRLGNYKLWLGIVYLAGLNLSLAGLTLGFRRRLDGGRRSGLVTAAAGAAVAAAACLLLTPWVRPDLAALWPPPLRSLFWPCLTALLWGGICGASLLAVRLLDGGPRLAWLVYLALALGPGPALAMSWFEPLPLALTLVIVAGMAGLWFLSRGRSAPAEAAEAEQPLALYWLVRSLILLWWGVGGAVTCAAAWWRPELEHLFTGAIWLRSLGLGVFLVACAGLLAEYTLPLVSRTPAWGSGLERKPLGLLLTSAALLAAVSLLLLQPVPSYRPVPVYREARARAELMTGAVTLSPDNPDVSLPVPQWLSDLKRVFVVSLLGNGMEVPQGATVAQLMAVDEQDIPHIFHLRAGIDTAEWALEKRDVARRVRHDPARYAQTWLVYTPTGEAFHAHSYFTGLFLGTEVNKLKSVHLRYLYKNPPDLPPVTLDLKRVFVN